MKKLLFLSTIIFGTLHVFAQHKWNYPPTPKVPVYDTIWGKVIQDDYRWMEDVKNPQFISWLSAQNQVTADVMAKIPNQERIYQSYKDAFNEIGTMYSGIVGNDSYAVYKKLNPGEDLSKWYYRDKKSGIEKLMFDPEKFVEGKIHTLSDLMLSDDGNLAVVSVSEAGKENANIRLFDMKSLKMLPDELMGRFPGFTKINGVQYISYQSVKSDDVHGDNFYGGELRLHVPGTTQSSDITIASAAGNPELNYDEQLSLMMQIGYDDPKNFYMYVLNEGAEPVVFYKPKAELFNKKVTWKNVVNQNEKISSVHLSEGYFYFLTTKNSPVGEFSRKKADGSTTTTTLYAPPKDWKISNLRKAKDYYVIMLTKNDLESRTVLYHTKTGKTEELQFPLNGIIHVTPLSSETNDATVIGTSWTDFSSTYSYNLDKKKLEKGWFFAENKIPENKFLTVEEVEIPSHDGVMIPLSLVYDKRFLKKDGSNICFMYGYGSFGYSISPFMKYPPYVYELGVILAVPHVRGGGEKGEEWHSAGKLKNKPNSWKDWEAAAEWLIKNKYTSPQKLSAEGGSAGGLLVGRLMTYRPDLFSAALIHVGLLNPLRGEFTPNAAPGVAEYGSLKKKEEAAYLYDADAYHHVKPGTKYPAQYITAGYNDPRVIVWQPAKYAAAVQSADVSRNPQLMHTEMESGHFGASTMDETMKTMAREVAFLLWQTGHPEFQPKK